MTTIQRLANIRATIRNGTYETPAKIDRVVTMILPEVLPTNADDVRRMEELVKESRREIDLLP